MAKFDDHEFFLYAFGPAGSQLTDEQFEKGLLLISKKLLFNAYATEGHYLTATEYMKKAHELLKKWIKDSYNVSGLDKYADFLNKNAEQFYGDEHHHLLVVNMDQATRSKKLFYGSVYPDMIEYYYKNGACIRNYDNDFVNLYRNFMVKKDQETTDIDQEKTIIRRKINTMSSIYPTKEQMREAYIDFLNRRNATGLDLESFIAPLDDNGKPDERYLTDNEKTAIVKNMHARDVKAMIKNFYINAFHIQAVTRDEAEAIHNDNFFGDAYWMTKWAYLRNSGLKKQRGDLLDKENVKKAINAITALKEIHERRPWYQRFFFHYGQVGKELTLIDQLKADLVRRGVPEGALNEAINGNSVAKEAIIDELPTKAERIKAQDKQDRKDYYRSLGLKGPEDPKILSEKVLDEEGHPTYTFYIKVDNMDIDIPNSEAIKYLYPQDMLEDKELKLTEEELQQQEDDDAVGLIDQFLLAKDQSKATKELINELDQEFVAKEEEDPFLDEASAIDIKVEDDIKLEEDKKDDITNKSNDDIENEFILK